MTSPRVSGRNALTQTVLDGQRSDIPVNRVHLTYTCADEHVTEVVLWERAEIPETWRCRVCSRFAALPDVLDPETGQWRPAGVPDWRPKSHLEQLHERRTKKQLEALLQERLDYVRENNLVR